MHVLDVFVAVLRAQRKRAANGLQPRIEDLPCHLAHGLIRRDPRNPLAACYSGGWFRFEKRLFGHGFLPCLAWGEVRLSNGPNPPPGSRRRNAAKRLHYYQRGRPTGNTHPPLGKADF